MKKGTKKGSEKSSVERRKHPRRTKRPASRTMAASETKSPPTHPSKSSVPSPARGRRKISDLRDQSGLMISPDHCVACGKGLQGEDRALFVEEEVGRIFCSEECITVHFQPEIDVIEKEYFKYRPKDDLSPEEREQFAHLRWITVQEPDELFREKRPSGDDRYTLISQFKPGAKAVWCVCICLFLRGEPSFLFMAFPTRSKALVERFRRGEAVEWESVGSEESDVSDEDRTDGLADGWSQSETLRAEIHKTREAGDIPREEYGLYEKLLEKTLEAPDELWILEMKDDGEPDRYHFIKEFPDEDGGAVHYVVVAQDSEQSESLEVLEQIPTRDPKIIQAFRKGRQELVVEDEDDSGSRTIH